MTTINTPKILSIGICLLLGGNQQVSAFAPNTRSLTTAVTHSFACPTFLSAAIPEGNENDGAAAATMSRRSAFNLSFLTGVASVMLSSPSPALAAKKEKEPITKENVAAAWADLRFEFSDKEGGVQAIQTLIEANDFEGVMEFTKGYDLELRKKRMGRCKKLMTDNASKEIGTMNGNAVTFDLIGINRNSRPGQENAEKANKYLEELRTDLSNFIKMEDTIDFNLVGIMN